MTKVRITYVLVVIAASFIAALNLCAISLLLGLAAVFATVYSVDPALHWAATYTTKKV